MCWSAESSIASLIVGTIVNALCIVHLASLGSETLVPIAIIVGWQYALLMQIPDALAWVRKEYETSGRIAFSLNVTQPLVCFCLVYSVLAAKSVSMSNLLSAAIVGIVYIYYLLTNLRYLDMNIKPTQKCTSLQYRWWDGIGSWLYCILMILTIMALPAKEYVWLTVGLFVISLAIVLASTKSGCNPGSAWCLTTAAFGLVTYAFALINRHAASDYATSE